MKFFKQNPIKCSICGAENPIKHARPFHFCQKCWDETYKKVAPAVFQQIQTAKETGKKIDTSDAKTITQQLVKQIQKEGENEHDKQTSNPPN